MKYLRKNSNISSISDIDDSFRQKVHRPILLIGYFAQMLSGIMIIIDGISADVIPLIISLVIWLLVIIAQRSPRFIYELLMIINIGFFTIWNTYLQSKNEDDDMNFETAYLKGMNFGVMYCLLMVFAYKKYHIVALELIFIVARVFIYKNANAEPIIGNILFDIACLSAKLFIVYREENFYEKIDRQRIHLLKFKEILHQNLPCNILILQTDAPNILFANMALRSELMFPLFKGHEDKLLEKIKNIKMELSGSSPENEKPKYRSILDDVYEIGSTCVPGQQKKCFFMAGDTKIHLEASFFHVDWDGVSAIGIVLSNINTLVESENLRAADINKEMAISTVAHELRNPMSGLFGTVELIDQQNKDPELKGLVQMMKTNIQYLLHLLNTILDLQQIKANKLTINKTNVSIKELFNQVKLIFEFQCSMKNIGFLTYTGHDLKPFIETDKERLTQILINLCANAVKFTSKGHIYLSAKKSEIEENKVEFQVRDTGVGMSHDDTKKLFKAFGKLDSTSAINQQGVGLGLMISNSLVSILNNDKNSQIEVESKLGTGTKFYFSLPEKYRHKSDEDFDEFLDCQAQVEVEMEEYQEAVKHDKSALRPPSTGYIESPSLKKKISSYYQGISGKTILIVDDNAFNLFACKQILESFGLITKFAYNGKEAIEEMEKSQKDDSLITLILMDCEMPLMNGMEASRILTGMMREGKMRKIPIVGCSGHINENVINECMSSGMCEYLKKPLMKKDVFSLLIKYNSL